MAERSEAPPDSRAVNDAIVPRNMADWREG
jgi:hypothetical protein